MPWRNFTCVSYLSRYKKRVIHTRLMTLQSIILHDLPARLACRIPSTSKLFFMQTVPGCYAHSASPAGGTSHLGSLTLFTSIGAFSNVCATSRSPSIQKGSAEGGCLGPLYKPFQSAPAIDKTQVSMQRVHCLGPELRLFLNQGGMPGKGRMPGSKPAEVRCAGHVSHVFGSRNAHWWSLRTLHAAPRELLQHTALCQPLKGRCVSLLVLS